MKTPSPFYLYCQKNADISEPAIRLLRINIGKISLLLFSKLVGGDACGYGVAFFISAAGYRKKYPEACPPPLRLHRVNFGVKRLSYTFFQLFEDSCGAGNTIARWTLPVKLDIAGDLFLDLFARHQDRRVVLIA
jgi:hypothetical protein